MPKIEVSKERFFKGLGKKCSAKELENILVSAKAELDSSLEEYEKEEKIKIELNDTNRPDLWTVAGLLRLFALHNDSSKSNRPLYNTFLSKKEEIKDAGQYVIKVSNAVKDKRPYIAGFLVKGKKISAVELDELIQTQEKICTNYGKKRRTIAMGVYRADLINWPVFYETESQSFSFAPLGFDENLTIEEILKKHPKGIEYGELLKAFDAYPILKDSADQVLSLPPVINSNKIGAVKEGDDFLFIEITGTQKNNVLLACNIVASDLSDAGWQILPVRIESKEKSFVTPLYFQKPIKIGLNFINKLLGIQLSLKDVILALQKIDSYSSVLDEKTLEVWIAPYRNDYLHPVDVVEDVMIALGLDSVEPEEPQDFTIGRLLPSTLLARKIKKLLIGMGYEQLIFNYLGSAKDYIEKMEISSSNVLQVLNPISENYQFVRPSILPSLLSSESSSATSTYPHKIFEIGKIAYIDKEKNTTKTINSIGFLTAEKEANYNKIASEISSLFYYLGLEYEAKEVFDTRFIPGRCASIVTRNIKVGIFGELSPKVLNNWEIFMPVVVAEIDVDVLLSFIEQKVE